MTIGQVVPDTLGHVQKSIGQTTTPYKGGVLSATSTDKTTEVLRRAYTPVGLGPLEFAAECPAEPSGVERKSAGDCSSFAHQFEPVNIDDIRRLSLTLSPRSTAIVSSIAAVLQGSGAAV